MIDPSDSKRSDRPAVEPALPSPPRDGFELGAIDVSAERPDHGLATDRSTRWLVGGLVGGSLVLAGIISLFRADDDAPSGRSGDGVQMQAVFGEPLKASLAAIGQSVRTEAVTTSALRALGETPVAPVPEPAARRPSTSTAEVVPAATTKPAAASSDARGGESPSSTTKTIDELPPPPPPESGDDGAKPAPAAEEPAPAEPAPTDEPSPPAEPAESPSGV